MRKFNILWKRHLEAKQPKDTNINVKSKQEIKVNGKTAIDTLDFL